MDIRLIGKPAILADDGELRPVRGHQSWALLARVLLAERPLSRRQLSAELFPSADDPLGALRWCLAGLRRALGSADVLVGDPVVAGLPAATSLDVSDVEAGTFDLERAGDLLEGIDPRCSPEMDTWLLVSRQRVAGLLDALVRAEVLGSLSAGATARALPLAELGVRRAVFDEGTHVLLVKSLVAAGRYEAALEHVDETEALFRRELGIEPTAALRSAGRRRLADAPPGVAPRAVAASLLESGRAALAAGTVDAGLECLRRAADGAGKAGDEHLEAVCLFELGAALVHAVRSHDDEGAVLLQHSADLAASHGDHRLAADAHRELGYVDALAGRRPSADIHLQAARQLAGDDDQLLAGIGSVHAFNLADWGRHNEALAEYGAAIERAEAGPNHRRLAWSLGLGSWAQLRVGDLDRAADWVQRSLALVADTRWVSFRPWPLAISAEINLAAGADPLTLRHDLDDAFALSCTLGDPCWEGATARAIGLTHTAVGEHDKALEWIDQSRRRCLRETDTYVAMHAAILDTEATISAAAGQQTRADEAGRALVALATRCHMDDFLARGLQIVNGTPDTTNS